MVWPFGKKRHVKPFRDKVVERTIKETKIFLRKEIIVLNYIERAANYLGNAFQKASEKLVNFHLLRADLDIAIKELLASLKFENDLVSRAMRLEKLIKYSRNTALTAEENKIINVAKTIGKELRGTIKILEKTNAEAQTLWGKGEYQGMEKRNLTYNTVIAEKIYKTRRWLNTILTRLKSLYALETQIESYLMKKDKSYFLKY